KNCELIGVIVATASKLPLNGTPLSVAADTNIGEEALGGLWMSVPGVWPGRPKSAGPGELDCTRVTGPWSPVYAIEDCDLAAGVISSTAAAAVSHGARIAKDPVFCVAPK